MIRPARGGPAILIAARFPDEPPPEKRWDLVLAGLTTLAVFGLYGILAYGRFRDFVYGATVLLVPFALTMSMLALRTYGGTDPVRRRQIRWVLYGAFVALAMLVFGDLAFLINPPLLWLAGTPMCLGLTALPVGFPIAVFGYRFLDVDSLISSATSYSGPWRTCTRSSKAAPSARTCGRAGPTARARSCACSGRAPGGRAISAPARARSKPS